MKSNRLPWEVEIKGVEGGRTWFSCQTESEARYWANDVLRMGGMAVYYKVKSTDKPWTYHIA